MIGVKSAKLLALIIFFPKLLIVCELMEKGDLHHYLLSLHPRYVLCVLYVTDQLGN